MTGNVQGGKQAAETNKAEYGEDFYKKIGAKGGKSSKAQGTIKGFALMKANGELDKIRKAGSLGGSRSKRRTNGK